MPSSGPTNERRLSVEDTGTDEVLPSYEDVIQEGPSTAAVTTTANSRRRTPSLRQGSSHSQQRSSPLGPSTASSSASPQQYSSLLDSTPSPTTVAFPSLTTTAPLPSSPIVRSPQGPQATHSPRPKYSSLLPPAPGPFGPPPDYNVTTSSLPELPPSRKGRKQEKKSRIQRWVFGETASQAYHEGRHGKKYAPAKNEGVPLEYVVDRFGNRKRELRFGMTWGGALSLSGSLTVGVKHRPWIKTLRDCSGDH
ncbi:unnamed protein product [Tuber aestivum]|uniref:Uncharacterized protein n=1 Tax=Tuber aestivum TaxID=59557 RepID=A0A292PVQ4_9PEZI|nr:unnamed protein product [Tuber aestivum]